MSNVTWTKDGNLLGSLFTSQGFTTVVNNIIAASPTITNTPNAFSSTGSYTITANDFNSNGRTSWFGAMAYVNYLNSINYGGSNQWYLPTVANATTGWNTTTNGAAKGDELVELFYRELNGTAGTGIVNSSPIPNTPTFDNEQSFAYWYGTEHAPTPQQGWYFDTGNGSNSVVNKPFQLYAWAVSPGQISASAAAVSAVPVPAAVWLFGSGLLGLVGLRRRRV